MDTRDRAPLAVAVTAAAGIALGGRFRTDLDLQDGLAGPLGVLLVGGLLVGTALSTRRLERLPDLRGFALAVWVTGTLSALVLVPANELEWVGGDAFAAPLWLQLPVYGSAMVGWCCVALGAYAWVARRSRPFARAMYVVFVAGWTAGGIAAVDGYEDDGTYVLDHGYSVAWDALWGVLMFGLALLLYELLPRRRRPLSRRRRRG